MKKTNVIKIAVLISAIAMFVSCCPKQKEETILVNPATPQEAIQALVDGNERFITKTAFYLNSDLQRIEETAKGQSPFAAIVSCSDSRVPVELIFDRGIGDIFVVRTVGNSVNGNITMGSVDYAIAHLDVKVVVILGHGKCGGITGAIQEDENEHVNGHSKPDGKVKDVIETLREDVKNYVGSHDLDAAIEVNAKAQVAKILEQEYVKNLVKEGKLIVVSAIYDINTGRVKFL